ncbi:hypothetical protein SKAU_G00417250 [Synaphobranchus kaupii]|uniref:Uncharacterized protein n=1 Tax=Synaphobranchus kaupii TaxID=118154 RepID=A0A9Q1E5Y0_SYNKA|nr:hypothetical protein SKAU_G00417250 [Synaphobranchus kaupii]
MRGETSKREHAKVQRNKRHAQEEAEGEAKLCGVREVDDNASTEPLSEAESANEAQEDDTTPNDVPLGEQLSPAQKQDLKEAGAAHVNADALSRRDALWCQAAPPSRSELRGGGGCVAAIRRQPEEW